MRRCQDHIVICEGLSALVGLGDICWIEPSRHNLHECSAAPGSLLAEVVAIDTAGVHLLPFDRLDGIGMGARVIVAGDQASVQPSGAWLGRVIDAFARPLDSGPPLPLGRVSYRIKAPPVEAHRRRDLGPRLNLGVRALNLFTPCRAGQRMGIFAGSGVGKSTLLSMLARHSDADALVLGLIGERGRELAGFLNDGLGPDGLARSVVVVATSDLPAMVRRRAAYLTLTVAEALRDRGMRVLCLFDSLTRYATALREIHLAAGEPPTSRGYPPSVFAELPRLLERAGPGAGAGSITGLFTVLVEGDDLSDPVADAVRAILDGHIVLDRRTAEAGRYPAVDVLGSLSRVAPECYGEDERPLVERARRLMRAYADAAELIQLGAYRQGGDPLIDEAIRVRPALEALLAQGVRERSTIEQDVARLAAALASADARSTDLSAAMDTLAVLAHLARQRLDQHRRALHGIDQALATTRDQLRILGQDIEEERRAACALTDGELLLVRYQRRVLERERALHIELGRLERERAAEARRIAEHHLEVRRLEILAERRARHACVWRAAAGSRKRSTSSPSRAGIAGGSCRPSRIPARASPSARRAPR